MTILWSGEKKERRTYNLLPPLGTSSSKKQLYIHTGPAPQVPGFYHLPTCPLLSNTYNLSIYALEQQYPSPLHLDLDIYIFFHHLSLKHLFLFYSFRCSFS